MNRLEEIIKTKISKDGVLTFREFMDMALYYPEIGYYTSSRPKIGRDGDFYTSPDVDNVFGQLMARQMIEMWEKLACPAPFFVVEYGAGKGILARDILVELKAGAPELFNTLVYGIIEISPSLQEKQAELLAEAGMLADPGCQVRWVSRLAELSSRPVAGCVISNELLDAFPVHLVQETGDGPKEAVVKLNREGSIVQEFSAPLSTEIEEFLSLAEINLIEGQIIEVNKESLKWLAEINEFLHRGYLVTIDYGYLSDELAAPHRFDGTLLCYEKHQVKENPYENIGNRDITAHVNFTALINYGEKCGLKKLGYLTQGKFLLNMGIFNLIEEQNQTEFDLERFSKIQRIKQLVMPGGMGDTFKILVQGKGLNPVEEELISLKPFYAK